MLEQGVPPREGESEEQSEGEGEQERVYTEEDMSHMRHIIVTDRRDKCLTKYAKMILGDQYGDEIVMFTTSFSYRIFQCVPREIQKIMKIKNPPERFDNLLGLTKILYQYDTWMHDYEDSDALKALSKQLGSAWKKLLALSDEELSIDSEFTRKGTEKFLETFDEEISSGPENIKFKWK